MKLGSITCMYNTFIICIVWLYNRSSRISKWSEIYDNPAKEVLHVGFMLQQTLLTKWIVYIKHSAILKTRVYFCVTGKACQFEGKLYNKISCTLFLIKVYKQSRVHFIYIFKFPWCKIIIIEISWASLFLSTLKRILHRLTNRLALKEFNASILKVS